MQISNRKSRIVALLTGVTVLSATFTQPAPVSANESKTWKYGAIGLGALGAYMLSKGKNVEGAAALGGAYAAYKKGEDEREEDSRNNRDNWRDNRRESRNDRWDNNRRDNRWDDHRDNRREDRWDNKGYGNNGYNNNGYGNGGYGYGGYNTYLR